MRDCWLLIASGPSLTRADCDLLRGLCTTVAINNAIFLCPWADYLYAGDAKWWAHHGPEIKWFRGERVSHEKYKGTRQFTGSGRFARFGGNSGHQAVQWAAINGAPGLALLGFDQKHRKLGKDEHGRPVVQRHFHGDHPPELGNAQNIDHWPRMMDRTAVDLKRMEIPVLNLTRDTALTCFERITVEAFVEQVGGMRVRAKSVRH